MKGLLFGFVLALVCMIPVQAKMLQMLAPLSGFALLDPTYPPPPTGRVAYSQTGGPLQWSVGPWSNPDGRMPPFSVRQDDGETTYFTVAPSVSATIRIGPSGTVIQLGQNGAPLACDKPHTNIPLEFDYFAQPQKPGAKPPYRPGFLPNGDANPPLASMSTLELNAEVTPVSGLAVTRKNCKANFANTIFSVILVDRATPQQQTYFYQLLLSRLCGTGGPVKLGSCGTPKQMGQFSDKNPFGIDDVLPLAGQAWLPDGQTSMVHVDLLPRLVEAIEDGKGGIDRNLANWTIDQIYFGQIIYGDVTLRSTWKNLSLSSSLH